MSKSMRRILFIACLFLLATACSGGKEGAGVSSQAQPAKTESRRFLEISGNLLSRYASEADSLKRKAAEYLLAGLPEQWHYDVTQLEESTKLVRVSDMKVVDADYLAENIDYAFKAWELPWAKDVSFEDFCRYLLPYKMGNEAPERWRAAVWEEFAALRQQALTEAGMTAPEICCRVAREARKWYTFRFNWNYPTDAGYLKAKQLREGTCKGASLMILYPLRALGVCATYDYVPNWGNRSGEHAWNGMYVDGRLIPFSSTDLEPGRAKQEFIGVGRMIRKRPKVLRKDYLNAGSIDVTTEYLQTADLSVWGRWNRSGEPQLMVFDNANWVCVDKGEWKGLRADYKAVARDVAFLPVLLENGRKRSLNWPLVVKRDGTAKIFRPRIWNQTVRLTAKYPEDDSNAIFPGEHYELFCWRGQWESLGKQEATDTVLVYDRVPKGALLWLRNLDKGEQERIFTYENGKQVWY